MPAPVLTVGNLIEIQCRGLAFGQRIMNVLHYDVTSATSAGEEGEDVTLQHLLEQHFESNAAGTSDSLGKLLCAALPPDYTLEEWRAQMIYSTRYAYVSHLDGGAGDNTDALTPNITGVITKRGWESGPHTHGDFFLGPLPSEAIVGGYLTDTYKTTYMKPIGDFLLRKLTVGTEDGDVEFSPIIYRREEPGSSKDVTTYTIQSTSRVMRRRTVGLGE